MLSTGVAAKIFLLSISASMTCRMDCFEPDFSLAGSTLPGLICKLRGLAGQSKIAALSNADYGLRFMKAHGKQPYLFQTGTSNCL